MNPPETIRRWNFKAHDSGVWVCRDHHDKGQPCEYVLMSPQETVKLIEDLMTAAHGARHTSEPRPNPLMSAMVSLPDMILALDAIWGALNAGGAVLETLMDPDDLRLVTMRDALRTAADHLQPILPS